MLILEGEAPRFVYANADEGGFFRPLHEEAELAVLAASRADLARRRAHGPASATSGRRCAPAAPASPAFLDLALAFGDERDPDVLTALRGPLAFCVDRLGREAGAESPARRCADASPRPSAPPSSRSASRPQRRRTTTRGSGARRCSPSSARSPRRRARSPRPRRAARATSPTARSLDPNLADAVVGLGARAGDAARFDAFLAAAEGASTPQERRRMLLALGEFRDPALVQRALALTLTDTVGTQDVAILLVRMLGNPAAREATWAFMKRRWPKLRRRLPPMLVTRPIEATPALGTRAARRDVAAFFKANPVPTAARALRQALERFDLDAELAARALPELRRWLAR